MTNQSTSDRKLDVIDLGLIDYKESWDIQHQLLKKRIDGEVRDLFLLCEHPHTYTLGKVANKDNLLFSENELEQKKINVFDIDRGGDITYHGPGQIVGYPIINLEDWKKDTHLYLRTLEEVIIKTCKKFGIEAERNSEHTGVWIANRKICAIGIKISRWVTMHGFAFNVNTNMDLFSGIIPCGIQNKKVTNLSLEINKNNVELSKTKDAIVEIFKNEFKYIKIKKRNIKDYNLK